MKSGAIQLLILGIPVLLHPLVMPCLNYDHCRGRLLLLPTSVAMAARVLFDGAGRHKPFPAAGPAEVRDVANIYVHFIGCTIDRWQIEER